MCSIVYGQCTDTMKQKLETLPAFVPIKEKQDHESAILLLDLIKSTCYNFEAEKNKVLAAIQTQKKAMSWRQSEWSTIAEYNDQFMNQARVSEACGGTFKLPGVTEIVLKDKNCGVVVSELNPTAKKALKNEVRGQVLTILFIDNANRIIYSDLLKTLENYNLMGQEK